MATAGQKCAQTSTFKAELAISNFICVTKLKRGLEGERTYWFMPRELIAGLISELKFADTCL